MKDQSYAKAFGNPAPAPTSPPETVAYMGSLEQELLQNVRSNLDGQPDSESLQKAREILDLMIKANPDC